jgi:hypothetical protein
MNIIKYKTQKAVAHAQRAPQLFGFELFITLVYLLSRNFMCDRIKNKSWAYYLD